MNRVIKYRYWINRKPYIFNIRDIESAMASSEIMSGKYTDRDEYIRLKDKNGIEIYEGDIVNTFSGKTYIDGRSAVEWCDNFAGFYLPQSSWGTEDLPRFEIISNIYENKELLQ